MADQYCSVDHIKFLLNEVHNLEEVLQAKRFADHDVESINLLIDAVKDLADKEFYPYYEEMDAKPAELTKDGIHVHPQVKTMLKKSGEMGITAANFDYEHGGMQLPALASLATGYVMTAANNSAVMYAGLTSGAARLITSFGTKEQIEQYVPNMLNGSWGGTMCLTEPQAGSSLSDITSIAYPQEDGSYKIEGQKIFISSGDHQCADNICLLYTSPSPRDATLSRMPSSA